MDNELRVFEIVGPNGPAGVKLREVPYVKSESGPQRLPDPTDMDAGTVHIDGSGIKRTVTRATTRRS